jgi:hypothetical protein
LGYELEGPYMVKFLSWQHKSDVLKFCNAILGIGIETHTSLDHLILLLHILRKKRKRKE